MGTRFKTIINRDNLSFSGMQWFMWSGYGIYFGFLVPYLKSCGYDEVGIGVVMSVQALVSSVAPVLWGALTDRLKSPKVILVCDVLIGCAAALLLPSVSHSYALLITVIVAVSLTVSSVAGVLDGWAMRLRDRGSPLNYGLVRGLGSLAFAITTVVVGAYFERHGMSLMFVLFFAVESITAVSVLTVRDRSGMPSVHETQAMGAGAGLAEKPLYRNVPYLIFIFLCAILFTAENAAHTFYPLLLQHAGGGTANLGAGLCIQALSEVPVMFLSSRLRRKFRDTTLLGVAMAFYFLRFFMFYRMTGVSGLVASQVTQSLSYGLFFPISVHYLSSITPVRLKATAITLATSVYYGLSGVLGGTLGGLVIERIGIRQMYLCAAVLALGVSALFFLAQALLRKAREDSRVAKAEQNNLDENETI